MNGLKSQLQNCYTVLFDWLRIIGNDTKIRKGYAERMPLVMGTFEYLFEKEKRKKTTTSVAPRRNALN